MKTSLSIARFEISDMPLPSQRYWTTAGAQKATLCGNLTIGRCEDPFSHSLDPERTWRRQQVRRRMRLFLSIAMLLDSGVATAPPLPRHAGEPNLEQRIFETFSKLPFSLSADELRSFAKSCADRRNVSPHLWIVELLSTTQPPWPDYRCSVDRQPAAVGPTGWLRRRNSGDDQMLIQTPRNA